MPYPKSIVILHAGDGFSCLYHSLDYCNIGGIWFVTKTDITNLSWWSRAVAYSECN